MKPSVYIETTVISYLTSRLSKDLVVAAHHQITEEWWRTRSPLFDLYASQMVIQEASAGDEEKANKRLNALKSVELLEITENALSLSALLMKKGGIPQSCGYDSIIICTPEELLED